MPLRHILADAGLLAEQPATCAVCEGASPTIDWEQTLAAPQGSCYVRVNLAGRIPRRRPAGRLRRRPPRAIRAMREYRDRRTGASPFSLVVPAEEAVDLGLYGDGVGDIVYAVREEFADEHGQILPQATRDEGAWGMRSLCVFSGAGIRPGSVIEKPCSLIDVAPTVCAALGIPPPLQADGRSLMQRLSTTESEEES